MGAFTDPERCLDASAAVRVVACLTTLMPVMVFCSVAWPGAVGSSAESTNLSVIVQGSIDIGREASRTFPFCRIQNNADGSRAEALRVGGLLELHESFDPEKEVCGDHGGWAAVQQSTTFLYLVANSFRYSLIEAQALGPEVVELYSLAAREDAIVGALAFDTCTSNSLAVQEVHVLSTDSLAYRNFSIRLLERILPDVPSGCLQGTSNESPTLSLSDIVGNTPHLMGVTGPMSSSSVLAASPFLTSVETMHTSYWAGSTLFDDVADFRYLFRTIASDRFQVEAIADLIEHFQWTYVSLVAAEDHVYSGQGYDLLLAEASRRGTFCFDVQARFNKGAEFRADLERMVSVLKRSRARVVILFAPVTAAKVFLAACEQVNIDNKIFIGSHDWVNRLEYAENSYQATIPILGFAPRNVVSSTATQITEDLKRALQNVTYLKEASAMDPWLRTYIEQQLKCRIEVHIDVCELSPASVLPAARPCSDADFKRFMPRHTMVISESIAVGMLSHMMSALLANSAAEWRSGRLPGSTQHLQSLRQLRLRCKNSTSLCKVFDSRQHTPPAYHVQNVQRMPSRFHDIVSIGSWDETAGFEWSARTVIDLKSFGSFQLSVEKRTERNESIPSSKCSTACQPGQFRVSIPGLPRACCWECRPCESSAFSNTVNADSCEQCPLGHGSNGSACVPFIPQPHGAMLVISRVLTAASGLGLAATVLTLVYFWAHRRAVLVRTSDVTLSTVTMSCMAAGHVMVLTLSLLEMDLRICRLGIWLGEPIKAIIAGTILVKTNRFKTVFDSMKILSRYKSRRVLLSSPIQLLFVAALTLVSVLLVGGFMIADPPLFVTELGTERSVVFCRTSTTWIAILSSYNCLLLLAGIVLAFLTRKLPDNYNESQLLYLASLTGFVVWLAAFCAFVTSSEEFGLLILVVFLESQVWAFWGCLYMSRVVQMIRFRKYREPRSTASVANSVTVKTLSQLSPPH
ncbi:taste receptor type 1 member 1-like [Sycon ciliatum]|uniref:taste receptor type 1 member 1-like n=1 Tax=Sycon ciliatum TaxID=27933 RepID=UPI0020AD6F33|eukprot:scpid26122/ scgid13487/ Metabotropic glutamate receptor 5